MDTSLCVTVYAITACAANGIRTRNSSLAVKYRIRSLPLYTFVNQCPEKLAATASWYHACFQAFFCISIRNLHYRLCC